MTRDTEKNKKIRVLALIIAGVLVNLLGRFVADSYGLMLYLDSIGTVLTAGLGGLLPGIISGLATNFVLSLSDPSAVYYAVLNVLIAACTAAFVRKGAMKRFSGPFILIVLLALIGGGLGSVLTYFLYGFAGEGITVQLVQDLYNGGAFGKVQAQFLADFLVDLADKAVTVLIAVLVFRAVPEHIKRGLYLSGWQQRPIGGKLRREMKELGCRKVSLRTKIMALIICSLLLVAVIAIWINYAIYMESAVERNISMAGGTAQLAAKLIDTDRVDRYLVDGSGADYERTEGELRGIMNSFENITDISISKVEVDGFHVIFDINTDEGAERKAGYTVPFKDSFFENVPDLLFGKKIDPIITDDSSGWLLTVYQPVYDLGGECVCYSAVVVSLDSLRVSAASFLARQISIFLGFFILVLSIGLYLAEYNMIYPINSIACCAADFISGSEDSFHGNLQVIKELAISTGDEIETLYNSFMSMAEDSVWYLTDINKKNADAKKMHNGLILVLADMVESRDHNTGQHVRKTAAYTWAIMDELRKDEKYRDLLTDEYIYAVVNSSPLHDIGKIVVPDAILNKPGKLTPEEFETMKGHAAAGRQIIEKAMESLPHSEYLDEARNLAAYHHERWDGSGYPSHLSGEDIPLSARIMAMADVFDALVSKRSYKEGYSVDKAFEIIREEVGTHFDPGVAEAFFRAQDTIRSIAMSYKERDFDRFGVE